MTKPQLIENEAGSHAQQSENRLWASSPVNLTEYVRSLREDALPLQQRLGVYRIVRLAAFAVCEVAFAILATRIPVPSYHAVLLFAVTFGVTSLPFYATIDSNRYRIICAYLFPFLDVCCITLGACLLGGSNSLLVWFYPITVIASAWLAKPLNAFIITVVSLGFYGVLIGLGAGYLQDWLPPSPSEIGSINAVIFVDVMLTYAIAQLAARHLHADVQARQQIDTVRLLARMKRDQENERKLLAANLHDSIVQWLTGSLRRVEVARLLLGKDPLGSNQELGEVEATLRRSILELRTAISQLYPSELGRYSLEVILSNFIKQWSSRTGIDYTFDVAGRPMRMAVALETGLYRIYQEALNNIEKHAHATLVTATLDFAQHQIELTLQDNGAGIQNDIPQTGPVIARPENNSAALSQLGLLGMHELADMVGGKLDFKSTRTGTWVSVAIPVQNSGGGTNGQDPSIHSG
jgi:signal transduction histidine kinase